jgi:polyphosphate kinase
MAPVPRPQTVHVAARPLGAEAPEQLTSPELYFNRELSLLAFHHRVFEQARDESLPLLERLRFLCIASTNLDEFFEVRVAGLRKQLKYGISAATPDAMTVGEVLKQVHATTHELVAQQYKLLNDELLPALAAEGIRFLRRRQWTTAQRAWIRDYFESQLLPIVSPIRLDPSHPFPRVLNKALPFVVKVAGEDAFGQAGGMAVVQAPRVLPRFIRLPREIAGEHDFVFLSSVIHAHVGELFAGMEVVGCFQFRVTRDTELMIDTEEVDDLRSALEGELPSRRYGDSVRQEAVASCSEAASRADDPPAMLIGASGGLRPIMV